MLLHTDFRDKITKFTKVTEFLDYNSARNDIMQQGDDINIILN